MKPWHIGTHTRVLSENYLMNTNTTKFRGFSKIFEESNLSIGRVRKSPRVTIRPSRIRECRTTKLALLGQDFLENKLHFYSSTSTSYA